MDRAIPLALVAAFGVLTAFRALRVYRTTGVNPIKVGGKSDDPVQGVTDRILKASIAAAGFVGATCAFAPGWKPYLVPIPWLEQGALQAVGAALGAAAIGWIGIAPVPDGRLVPHRRGPVGEDGAGLQGSLFPLAESHLPRRRRLRLRLLPHRPERPDFRHDRRGLHRIAIQARLEEQYLLGKHPEEYRAYRSAVRRWL